MQYCLRLLRLLIKLSLSLSLSLLSLSCWVFLCVSVVKLRAYVHCWICVFTVFTARCTIVQSRVLQSHVVCPSVCDVGGSWPHRLKILETNCANNKPNIFALRSPKVIHLLQGEHEKISGRKCSFNTYLHNVRLNWVNRESRGCVARWLFVYFCRRIARSSLQ